MPLAAGPPRAAAGSRERARPRILILRALGLGDFLTGVPAYRAVRRAFTGHRLVLAAPGVLAPLVPLTGAVDELLPTAELRPVPWTGPPPDVAIDLHGRGPASHRLVAALCPRRLIVFGGEHAGGYTGPVWRPDEHEVARWCRLCLESGIPADPADLLLAPPQPPGSHALRTYRPSSSAPSSSAPSSSAPSSSAPSSSAPSSSAPSSSAPSSSAPSWSAPAARWRPRPPGSQDRTWPEPTLVHPGAAAASRRWPAARFAAVARWLVDRGHSVQITGSASERDLARQVARLAGLPETHVLAGRTSLAELAAVTASARLVISGDTGLAHLASAYARPSVTLFGPVPPSEWGPPQHPRHQVLWEAAPGYRGDPHGRHIDPALEAITAEAVCQAADAALHAPARHTQRGEHAKS